MLFLLYYAMLCFVVSSVFPHVLSCFVMLHFATVVFFVFLKDREKFSMNSKNAQK